MKVYDLHDAQGRLTGFEIDNGWLQPRGVRYVLNRLPRARTLPPSGAPDERARFEVDGVRFQMIEPFGDNSRYLVTPEVGVTPLTADVRRAFADYRPSASFRVAGGVASTALLVGAVRLLAFGVGLVDEGWAPVGLGGLLGGAMALFMLVVFAVMGLAGGTGARNSDCAGEQ
jgi:hypothetical protein